MSKQNIESLAHDIIIYESTEILPAGLSEVIRDAGGSSRYVDTAEAAEAEIGELKKPILIVTISQTEDEAISIIKSVIKLKALNKIPIILIGESSDGYEGVLEKYFVLNLCIEPPKNSKSVIDALHFISRSYPVGKKETPEVTTTAAPRANFEERYKQTRQVTEQVFDHLDSLSIKNTSLASDELKGKLTLEHLDKIGLIPTNPKLKAAVEEVYEQLSHWPREHVCRVSYICDRFNTVLNISEEDRETSKIASLLFPWAFAKNGSGLLRKNYLIGDEKTKLELSNRLKDSAMKVMSELEHSKVGNLIGSIAALIVGEKTPQDPDVPLIASNLTAANLIDRVCFQSGYWNPKGANFLLKEAKLGELTMLHEQTLACVVKFLSEGISNLPRVFLTPTDIKEDADLQEIERQNFEYEPEAHERKVSIDLLQPGMRLSKPILAYDGREVLSEEVILDSDLIWRLWQLSAIRPMNTPLIVEQKD